MPFIKQIHQSIVEKAMRGIILNRMFPHQNRMVGAVGLLGIYQRTGIQKVVRSSGMLKVLPETMRIMEKVLPRSTTKKRK